MKVVRIVITPVLMWTFCFSRDTAQEAGGAWWVERAAAAAEATGQIKGLWKLSKMNRGLQRGLAG